jgi:hypothetical protein
MAHNWLGPKPGSPYHSPANVIDQLRAEFLRVTVNAQKGAENVGKTIAQLNRMKTLSPPPASEEEIERLRSVQEQAVAVTFSDEASPEYAYLEVTLTPGYALFFGYSSPEHQEAARPLLERCASILGYEIG